MDFPYACHEGMSTLQEAEDLLRDEVTARLWSRSQVLYRLLEGGSA